MWRSLEKLLLDIPSGLKKMMELVAANSSETSMPETSGSLNSVEWGLLASQGNDSLSHSASNAFSIRVLKIKSPPKNASNTNIAETPKAT